MVDEYSDLLADLLEPLVALQRRNHTWSYIFSHDIDRIRKKTAGIVVRESLDYLLLNRRNERFGHRISRWRNSMGQFFRGKDAYEESILRILESHQKRKTGGCFLFKSVIKRHLHDANDYLGYPFFDLILERIGSENIEMGYHSGYEAGGDPDQMRAEYGKLCNRVGNTINVHRSHYLRYKQGVTFPNLEQLGIQVDSSVAWADQTGFRAQTCRPYPLFDVASNRQLNVTEIPLSVMDTQPFGYMKLTADEAISYSTKIVNTVKRHSGVMVWNFHHHIYDELDAPQWHLLLESAFALCEDGIVATFNSIHEKNSHVYD